MAATPGNVQVQPQQPLRQADTGMAPVFQEINLAALQGRAIELQGAIGRMLVTFQTQPSIKWSEALGQFAVINLQLFNLVEDMKQSLKIFVVRPKHVTGEMASVLPIMLSSKLLPEMEAGNDKLIGSTLAPLVHLPLNVQAETLLRQVDAVKMACEAAERAIAEGRKKHSLDGRRAPVTSGPKMDAARVARLAEQEKLLRNAVLTGEGLHLRADQQDKPAPALPSHLSRSVDTPGTLGASPATGPGLPRPPSSAAMRRATVSQTGSPATPYVRTPLVGTPGGPGPSVPPHPGSGPGQVAASAAALKAGSPLLNIPSPSTRSPGTLSPSVAAGGARGGVQQAQLQDGMLQGKHHAQQQLLQQRHDQEQQILQQHQHQQLQQLQQRQRQLLQQQGGRGQLAGAGGEGSAAGAPLYAASPPNVMPGKAGLGPTLGGQPGGGIAYGAAANAGAGAAPSQQKFIGQASSYTQQQR